MKQNNPFVHAISQWFQRNFSDPGAVNLFMTLLVSILIVVFFGDLLMPVLVSIVIAYLLNTLVHLLKRLHCPHMLAVMLVYILFLGTLLSIIFVLFPLLIRELSNLIQEAPKAISVGQTWVQQLSAKYPHYFSVDQLQNYILSIQHQLTSAGQVILKYSLATIPNIIHLILYLILVPLFVFFFLKDSQSIINWASHYMPKNRSLSLKVWHEVNKKIGAYVKGRVLEIIIVTIITSITFAFFGLNYAVLLGVAFGISVIIPYIGAIIVTLPIILVALFQFGFSMHFGYILASYALITLLDANILVPYLFSESMDLHPLVIIISVIVFGGLWGFWGVFFAIPLATVIDVMLRLWPQHDAM